MQERLSKEICAIIKRELKTCGISYRELAALLDVSEVSVKRLLNCVQPLSIQRLIQISQAIHFPVSKLFEEAETNLAAVPLFTREQDAAFFACPALFTFWSELSERRTVEEVAQRHQLDDASTYLYLRKLERAALIELRPHNDYRLLAPAHTSFEKGAKFPSFFTSQVLSGLQTRVLNIPADDEQAFLISLKVELTDEEFIDINHKLDDWMFRLLRESQDLSKREGLKVQPYTFGLMGAKGAFHDTLPAIPPLTRGSEGASAKTKPAK